MNPTAPQRGTQHPTQAPRLDAGEARTFSRRIDCADCPGQGAAARPARGGGRRDPETGEHGRARRG